MLSPKSKKRVATERSNHQRSAPGSAQPAMDHSGLPFAFGSLCARLAVFHIERIKHEHRRSMAGRTEPGAEHAAAQPKHGRSVSSLGLSRSRRGRHGGARTVRVQTLSLSKVKRGQASAKRAKRAVASRGPCSAMPPSAASGRKRGRRCLPLFRMPYAALEPHTLRPNKSSNSE